MEWMAESEFALNIQTHVKQTRQQLSECLPG